MGRFYITTPIYYVNAEPHLGHASTTIMADAIARSRRLLGDDVFFLTGTDEHGQKIERAARKAGVSPKAFADRIASRFRDLSRQVQATNDDFLRTTEPRHHRAVQEIWRRVAERGDLYKGRYEGWFCHTEQVFVAEAQVGADQRCPDCGNPLERVSEDSYFFRLSRYQAPLLEHYEKHPEFVTPDIRRNEMLAFLRSGLRDLSVSRTSFTWGVPVPGEPGHVVYVWFDALTNYLTALGFGSDADDDRARVEQFWPADVHLMGKEIVRQHAIYWPAFLMSAGIPLPKQIVAHGFWIMEGAKMSKSLGNVVEPDGYIGRFGVDALRYFVLREMSLGGDSVFTDESFLARYNADLANDLGNLVSRTATMIERYCEGRVPARGEERAVDRELIEAVRATAARVIDAVRGFDFPAGLAAVWELVGRVNRYLVAQEPWKLAKLPDRRTDLEATLYWTADALRVVTALIDPVMPDAASRIRRVLGIEPDSWVHLVPGTLAAGTALGRVDALFPRIDQSVEELRRMADEQKPPVPETVTLAPESSPAASQPPGSAEAPAATSPRITIDDFMKVELKVARVLAAEAVPKSKRLLKLSVDLGTEQRTLVAGIAESYAPESLIGRSVVIVANLQPATLMGIESNGMVLAASPDGGRAELVTFGEAPPPPGTRVR